MELEEASLQEAGRLTTQELLDCRGRMSRLEAAAGGWLSFPLVCTLSFHCIHDAHLALVLVPDILPQVEATPGEARLDAVALVLRQMSLALVCAAGSMWSSEQVDVHLRHLIEHLAGALERLVQLQEASTVEGAHHVLARLRSHHPEVSTHSIVMTVPENRPLEDFFVEVAEAALVVATDRKPVVGVRRPAKQRNTWEPFVAVR